MKTFGKLWQRIIDAENIRAGWFAFRKNHGNAPGVPKFEKMLDSNLEFIRKKLADGTWEPGNYHQFRVFEPKPRTISCCPVRDRVVHHALCQIVAPLMERRFIDQSYACRKGKGSHMAVKKARELANRYKFFLKIDVRHYFDSVDHEILLGIMRAMFREKEVNGLIRKIVEKEIPVYIHDFAGGKALSSENGQPSTTGLPIGNLTSQWFANLYLDAFDHYAVEDLRLGKRFMRYMDDVLIFFDTKEEAWDTLHRLQEWLFDNRNLELKDSATVVAPVTEGIPFLGLRIWSDRWRLKRSRLRRTRRSMRKHYRLCVRGETSEENLQNIIRSMEGSMGYFGFKGIYKKLDEEYTNKDGEIRRVPEVGLSTGRRVIRGGNYNNDANNCSSANRNNNVPGNVNANYGIRLVSVSYEEREETTKANRVRRPHSGKPALGEAIAETKMQNAAARAVSHLAQTLVNARDLTGCDTTINNNNKTIFRKPNNKGEII
ncbi:MAG: group II intron reverse transcriptase domain-containing protein [Kiritimatiellae bacterium]|nr:group II intron reverse transcriptase domain-containing protein [Kiritimatiellia bacterium]